MNTASPELDPPIPLLGCRVVTVCATALFLSLLLLCGSAVANDADRDGVVDHLDRDQDNDGLLNQSEGYRSVTRDSLTSAQTLLSVAAIGPSNQSDGSQYVYRLLDGSGAHSIDFAGTVLSTTTRMNWGVHENLPKIRNQTDGTTVVRWRFNNVLKGGSGRLDIDLKVSDLDADRRESIHVQRQSVVAYSITANSNIRVSDQGVDKLKFTAVKSNSGPHDDSVILHLRDIRQLVISYESKPNKNAVDGVENDAAGFRHSFNALVLENYQRVEASRDSDLDGVPDHQDLDSDNDGINDVDSAKIADRDTNGMADGAVNRDGSIELTRAAGSVERTPGVDDQLFGQNATDADRDGIIDVYDDNPAQFGEGDTDTDGDGLGDDREKAIGTDIYSRDTDSDGVSDADEVLIHRTNPLGVDLNSNDTSPDVDMIDSDNDSLPDELEGLDDPDDDGVPNQYDIDSDNDGIADIVEAGVRDANGDGMVDDGVVRLATRVSLPAVPDFDSDGIANYLDLDSDQDKKSDLLESGGLDVDFDGRVDAFVDQNGDGWDDRFFGHAIEFADTDGDGEPDVLDATDQFRPSANSTVGLQMLDDTVESQSESVHTGTGGCSLSAFDSEPRFTLLLLLIVAVYRVIHQQAARVVAAK